MEYGMEILKTQINNLKEQIQDIEDTILNFHEINKVMEETKKEAINFWIDDVFKDVTNESWKINLKQYNLEYKNIFDNLDPENKGFKLKYIIESIKELGLGEFARLKHSKLIRECIIDKPEITDTNQYVYHKKDAKLAILVQIFENLNNAEFTIIMKLIDKLNLKSESEVDEFIESIYCNARFIKDIFDKANESFYNFFNRLFDEEGENEEKNDKDKTIIEEKIFLLIYFNYYQKMIDSMKNKAITDLKDLLEKQGE